jgi:molybdopterin synthase catalytic subunit
VKIKVLFFASCRDIANRRELDLEVPDGATADQALDRLCESYPRLSDLRGRMALSLNEEYVSVEKTLMPGDTLALIPPVSGGKQ